MIRLYYRVYRLASSFGYWFGRRFTQAGMIALGGLALTAGMGIDTEQALAYQTFALLGCLLASGMLSALFFRGHFAVRRSLPRFASVGEPLTYSIGVRNQTAKPQRGLEVLENLADPRPPLAAFRAQLHASRQTRSFTLAKTPSRRSRRATALREQPLPDLPPGGEAEARMELTPLKRGPLRFTGVTVARPDPLGLFRAFVVVPLAHTVLVLPKRYPLPPLALPGTRHYQQGGVALASAVGQSEEFVALRDYRRGDPWRHVHWKSWAKTGRLIVKEFQDEFFVRHALILDTFTGADHAEVFEEAVSIAASFACALGTQESLLDLMFVGPQAFCFTAGRGLAHADQILEILASVSVCREQPFRALRELVVDHVAAVSGCVCVFVAWDEPRRELVRELRALGLPLLVLVVTADGATLDPGPMKDQPERFHALTAGRIEAGLARL